jgi:purine-binding chemotaxis protein CheW
MNQIVVFTIDDLACALPIHTVLRVIHAVEIKRLPKAPEIISGVINVNGRIIPVVDIRKRFGFTAKDLDADDQFVIADTGKRLVALIVDAVSGIRDINPLQLTDTRVTLPFAKYIMGIVKVGDELILINDLEQFLNLEEEKELEKALSDK